MQEHRSATSLLPEILRHSAAACMLYTKLPTWTASGEVTGSAACPTLQRTCMCGICCRSGGIQGGLSNGELIVAKIAFKPTSTIARKQNTVSRLGESVELLARGRHDPCVVPRAVPMVEAMAALVLADQLLQVIMQRTHARKRQADRSQRSLIKAPFPGALSQQASKQRHSKPRIAPDKLLGQQRSSEERPAFLHPCMWISTSVSHQLASLASVWQSGPDLVAVCAVQHYAQCELLPREGACSPDTSIPHQFRQQLQNQAAEAHGVVAA